MTANPTQGIVPQQAHILHKTVARLGWRLLQEAVCTCTLNVAGQQAVRARYCKLLLIIPLDLHLLYLI